MKSFYFGIRNKNKFFWGVCDDGSFGYNKLFRFINDKRYEKSMKRNNFSGNQMLHPSQDKDFFQNNFPIFQMIQTLQDKTFFFKIIFLVTKYSIPRKTKMLYPSQDKKIFFFAK